MCTLIQRWLPTVTKPTEKKPLISVFMSRGGGVWAGRKERGSGEECQPIKIHT